MRLNLRLKGLDLLLPFPLPLFPPQTLFPFMPHLFITSKLFHHLTLPNPPINPQITPILLFLLLLLIRGVLLLWMRSFKLLFNECQTLFWNVWGLNDSDKHRPFVSWLQCHKPIFGAILETHIKEPFFPLLSLNFALNGTISQTMALMAMAELLWYRSIQWPSRWWTKAVNLSHASFYCQIKSPSITRPSMLQMKLQKELSLGWITASSLYFWYQ